MTPEERAETLVGERRHQWVYGDSGLTFDDEKAVADIASAIREAVDAERLEIIKMVQAFREDGENDLRSIQQAIRGRRDVILPPQENA